MWVPRIRDKFNVQRLRSKTLYRTFLVKMEACNHVTADDYGQGTKVCLKCGKVMDDMLFGEHDNNNNNSSDDSFQKFQDYYRFSYDTIIREFLCDSLAPIHLDQGFLNATVIGRLYQIALMDPRHENYLSLSLRNAKDRGRLAYLVWDTLQAQRAPRPPADIAYLLQTSTKFMRETEKELQLQPSFSPLCAYVPRLTHELYLPQWIVAAVDEAAWHCGHATLTTPEHYIGAMLLLVGKYLKPTMVGCTHLLTADNISQVVGCSSARLIKLCHLMPFDVRSSIITALIKKAKKQNLSDVATDLGFYQAKLKRSDHGQAAAK